MTTKTISQLTPAVTISSDGLIEIERAGGSFKVGLADLRAFLLSGYVAHDIDPKIGDSIRDIVEQINEIIDSIGSGDAAAASAQASEASRVGAMAARGIAETMAMAAQLARDMALRAREEADLAKKSAENAEKEAIENARQAAKSVSDANGFATTARGSAEIAIQKADESGQHASIARSSIDIATTKAGEARVSASQAAVSENNAQGSAHAAFASQTLTAELSDQAAGHAKSASETAASAAAKADLAGESASASQRSALAASTKAGEAAISADTAVRSASDAAGSAASFAERATAIEASATSGGGAVRNDNFALWPDPAAHPAQWGPWVTHGNYRIERLAPGRAGSPYCILTSNDVEGATCGFVQTVYSAGGGKHVIDVTADTGNAGGSGAGVTINGFPGVAIDFCGDPDVAGTVGDIPNAVRSWSKLVDIPGRDVTDLLNVHAMHGWAGFGRPIPPKTIVWHRLRLRPATDAEIKAGKADAALNAPNTGVVARLARTETAVADAPNRYAAVARVDAMAAQLNFATDSGLKRTLDARIDAAERASADADRAFAERAVALEATASTGGSGIVSNDNFNVWPAGETHPSRWRVWEAGGNYRTQRLSPGRGGGQFCVRTLNDVADVNSGFFQQVYSAGGGKHVIDVTADFDGSGARGAGVTIHGLPGASIDFCGEADVAGAIGDIPNAVRSWSKLVDIPGRDVVDLLNVHAMHGWLSFGRGVAPKHMVWHRLRLRPATDAEIKAGKADAALNTPTFGVLARLASSEATIADLPNRYAAVRRTEVLEAQVGETRSTVTQHAAVIADKLGPGTATFSYRAEAGGGVASITGIAGAGAPSILRFQADVIQFDGRAIFSDSVGVGKLARAEYGSQASYEARPNPPATVAPGGTYTAIPVMPLGFVGPGGSFLMEVRAQLVSNVGSYPSQHEDGRTVITTVIDDGGLTVNVGTYSRRFAGNVSETSTAPNTGGGNYTGQISAVLRAGNYDSGLISDGEFYRRTVSATYTLYALDVKGKWTFI